jgi:hypothetical protein
MRLRYFDGLATDEWSKCWKIEDAHSTLLKASSALIRTQKSPHRFHARRQVYATGGPKIEYM